MVTNTLVECGTHDDVYYKMNLLANSVIDKTAVYFVFRPLPEMIEFLGPMIYYQKSLPNVANS